MVCLSRPNHFKFFKGCLQQISLGPFLNTLSHLIIIISSVRKRKLLIFVFLGAIFYILAFLFIRSFEYINCFSPQVYNFVHTLSSLLQIKALFVINQFLANDFQPLTTFAKCSSLNVWLSSECTSKIIQKRHWNKFEHWRELWYAEKFEQLLRSSKNPQKNLCEVVFSKKCCRL